MCTLCVAHTCHECWFWQSSTFAHVRKRGERVKSEKPTHTVVQGSTHSPSDCGSVWAEIDGEAENLKPCLGLVLI